jgi:hypothetical protein
VNPDRRFGLVGWLHLLAAFGPVLYAMVWGMG